MVESPTGKSGESPGNNTGARFAYALVAFVLVNFLVLWALGPPPVTLNARAFDARNYQDPMYGTWTWWMARAFVNTSKNPDVVLLGSSQMNSPAWAADATLLKRGVDCLLHRDVLTMSGNLAGMAGVRKSVNVFNCALQGGVASDYYMIARALFQGDKIPRLVVIGVSPRDFIDNKLPAASSTEAFRFFSRFADSNQVASIAYTDPRDRLFAWLDWQVRSTPLRRISEIIESYATAHAASVPAPSSGRSANELMAALYNTHQQVKIGQWVVPPNMEPIFVDNSKEYGSRYQNTHPESLPIQLAFFDEVLKSLNKLGCAVLVVGMPTVESNRQLLPAEFWTEYKTIVSSKCRSFGARWIDLSDSPEFVQADFVDTVHMNDRGGKKFFEKLAGIIAADQKLARAIKGTDAPRLAGQGVDK
jgi:hypothetical protein